MDAAQRCPGLPWNVLAAIGKAESDHGRGLDAGIHSGTNPKGAMGPMQFLAPTWAAYGVDADDDGRKNVYDPADAIHGAARYLCANGGGKGGKHLRRAIWHYNHADWYVDKVIVLAAKYAQQPTGGGAIAVRAALRWLGTPYSWGGGGPAGPSYGTAQGAGIKGFDCSGLTQYAWAQAGVRIDRVAAAQYDDGPHIPRSQLQPGDLLFFAYNHVNPASTTLASTSVAAGWSTPHRPGMSSASPSSSTIQTEKGSTPVPDARLSRDSARSHLGGTHWKRSGASRHLPTGDRRAGNRGRHRQAHRRPNLLE